MYAFAARVAAALEPSNGERCSAPSICKYRVLSPNGYGGGCFRPDPAGLPHTPLFLIETRSRPDYPTPMQTHSNPDSHTCTPNQTRTHSSPDSMRWHVLVYRGRVHNIATVTLHCRYICIKTCKDVFSFFPSTRSLTPYPSHAAACITYPSCTLKLASV